MIRLKYYLTLFIILTIFSNCEQTEVAEQKMDDTKSKEAAAVLESRNAGLTPKIIKVTDGVYTAIGYDVSTVTLIETANYILYVDSGMLSEKVEQIRKEFRKITSKPVHSIFLTHGHGDHTGGVKILSEGRTPDVWGMNNFGSETQIPKDAKFKNRFRGLKQGGFLLSEDERINNGIAPAVYPTPNGKPIPLKAFTSPPKKSNFDTQSKPNKFVSGDKEVLKIDGITVELIASPGETADGMLIWLPEKKIVWAGDNFYRSWPNLYAIRGTVYRDVNDWIKTLQRMVDLGPHYLIGGHTLPVLGEEEVTEVLGNYKDAIEYIFNKTIDGMNKGMNPDQLVEYAQLPDKYKNLDYLGEYYGRVDWSVRSIHNGYLGWYDGNPTQLIPLSPLVEAQKMVEILGGVDKLEKHVRNALNAEEYQWAAELSDRLLALDDQNPTYKIMKSTAMRGLGVNMSNALGRNVYLTESNLLKFNAKVGQ